MNKEKIILAILAMAILLTVTPVHAAASSGSGYATNETAPETIMPRNPWLGTHTIRRNDVPIRNNPSTLGSVIAGWVHVGARVHVTSVNGEWARVQVLGSTLTGYMSIEFLF